jgi:hypothetical protein
MDPRTYATDLGLALSLLGNEAEGLPPEIRMVIEKAASNTDPTEQAHLVSEIRERLARPGGAAEQKLRDTADAVAKLRRRVAFDLAEAAPDFGVDPYHAEAYAAAALRAVAEAGFEEVEARNKNLVSMAPGGVGGGKSRKWKNLRINRHKLLEFGAHGAMFGLEGSGPMNPLLLVVGVALMINCAWDALTVKIPEQEASVLWGLMAAQAQPGNEASAPEPDVVVATNAERQVTRSGTVLGAPLPPETVRRSLEFLEQIRTVARVDGTPTRWQIVESHRIE